MRSQDLTRQQLAWMEERLLPTLRYLNKLLHRTSHRNFPDDDPLRIAVREAQLSMQKLVTELRTCHAGALAPEKKYAANRQSGCRLGRPKKDSR